MKSRAIATLSVSALVLTSGLVGAGLMTGTIAFAGGPNEGASAQAAASNAAQARKVLADGKPLNAVPFAEAAVRAAPQNQAYRALLGQVYLLSGRFASARDAFGDALALSPNDGRSALSYALAQIANGDWTGARQTLDSHVETIDVADRGLAIALAGDPATAVDLLTTAARAPEADAKTRQNLALSLALAGRWPEARSVAAVDLTPAELDKRMVDWAIFARPVGAADQVASLLKVIPVQDSGQPVALALNARVPAQPVAVAKAESVPVETSTTPQAVETVAKIDTVGTGTVTEVPHPSIVFGPRAEVVQSLPVTAPVGVKPTNAALQASVAKPAKVMALASTVPVAPLAKGKFFLQLGAYENAAVAQDGWKRAIRRFPALRGHAPSGMTFKTEAGSFYRLSVGGFARADAVALCKSYRHRGGNCFVREDGGDQSASWVAAAKPVAKPAGKQLASR